MPPASDPPYSAPERVTDFRAAITAVRDQGTNMDDDQEAAFSCATRLKLTATLGRAYFTHSRPGVRDYCLAGAEAIAANRDCPPAASQSIRQSVRVLQTHQPVKVDFSACDEDVRDHTNNVSDMVKDIMDTLLDMLFDGRTFAEDSGPAEALYGQVRRMLNARISFELKLELAAVAIILWPHKDFALESAAFGRFHADHRQHLRTCGLYGVARHANSTEDVPRAAHEYAEEAYASADVPASVSGIRRELTSIMSDHGTQNLTGNVVAPEAMRYPQPPSFPQPRPSALHGQDVQGSTMNQPPASADIFGAYLPPPAMTSMQNRPSASSTRPRAASTSARALHSQNDAGDDDGTPASRVRACEKRQKPARYRQ